MNTLEITGEDGSVLARIKTEPEMNGAALEFAGVWHSPTQLDQYAAHLTAIAQALREAGVK